MNKFQNYMNEPIRRKDIYGYILCIGLFLYLTSCSTSKKANCDAYGYIQRDTIELTTEHFNFEGECRPSKTYTFYMVDTLYIPKIK